MSSSSERPRLHEAILYDEASVAARIEEIAGEIIGRYTGEDTGPRPLFVCLLRGVARPLTRNHWAGYVAVAETAQSLAFTAQV